MWRHEDGGPARLQSVAGRLDARAGTVAVTTRAVFGATMVVGDGDRLFLLRHTAGDDGHPVAAEQRRPAAVFDEPGGLVADPGGKGTSAR